jgi:hypothetical protein
MKPKDGFPLFTSISSFFLITQYNVDALNTHVHSPYEHKYTNPTPSYGHLQKTKPVDLKIHEVTTGASLSTGTSSTAESIAPLNPGIQKNASIHAKSRT